MGEIITNIEKYKRGWVGGLPETPCGYGSLKGTTAIQRTWIPEIVRRFRIKTIADIGAGDLNWMKTITFPRNVTYTPYDLVPRAESVIKFDLLNEETPKVDLVICLWVLNHFPMEEALKAMDNIKASGSKYLMVTFRHKWKDEMPPQLNDNIVAEIDIETKQGDVIRLIKL